MEIYRFVFSYFILVLFISNWVDSLKNNDGIYKDLGLEEKNGLDDLNISFSTSHKVLFGNTLVLSKIN